MWTQPSRLQQDREISTTGKVPDDTLAFGLVKHYAVDCKRGYRGGLRFPLRDMWTSQVLIIYHTRIRMERPSFWDSLAPLYMENS